MVGAKKTDIFFYQCLSDYSNKKIQQIHEFDVSFFDKSYRLKAKFSFSCIFIWICDSIYQYFLSKDFPLRSSKGRNHRCHLLSLFLKFVF